MSSMYQIPKDLIHTSTNYLIRFILRRVASGRRSPPTGCQPTAWHAPDQQPFALTLVTSFQTTCSRRATTTKSNTRCVERVHETQQNIGTVFLLCAAAPCGRCADVCVAGIRRTQRRLWLARTIKRHQRLEQLSACNYRTVQCVCVCVCCSMLVYDHHADTCVCVRSTSIFRSEHDFTKGGRLDRPRFNYSVLSHAQPLTRVPAHHNSAHIKVFG